MMFPFFHNQDFNNFFQSIRHPASPEDINVMIDRIAASGVDGLLLCTNAEVANHPSKTFGTLSDLFPEEISLPENVPQSYSEIFAHDCQQFRRLHNAGCDYLAHSLHRAVSKGLKPGISVRMNDMHGGEYPECALAQSIFQESSGMQNNFRG